MLQSYGGPQFRLALAILVLICSAASLLYLAREPTSATALPERYDLREVEEYLEAALEIDPPPDAPPYGAVVIAAQSTTDLHWTMFTKVTWQVYAYDVDQPRNPDIRLQFPKSKGHEAMIYLSFIIDHYDDLPWCTVFVHGIDNDTWHQDANMVEAISGLQRVPLARQGYVSLRCEWYTSCPTEDQPPKTLEALVSNLEAVTKGTQAAINGNWHQLFPHEPLPPTFVAPSGAQFAVTRQAILRRPKSDYERLRKWLLATLLEDDMSGRVFEQLWAYIFLRESIHCPSPDKCSCEWFGRCDTHALDRHLGIDSSN